MVYEGREYRKLRILIDLLLIIGTISIIFLRFDAIYYMAVLWIAYISLVWIDAKPKPTMVSRWNKQAGRYITYEIDQKTGKYIKRVIDIYENET